MFPIGDSPNPRGVAWVTYALIAVNVVVYLLCLPMMSQPADLNSPAAREYLQMLQSEQGVPIDQIQAHARQLTQYDLFVFENGSRPSHPSLLDILKSMFLHAGFMHLFGNMLFLWIYGNNTEYRLGRFFYLIAYLATGYAAAFGDMLLRPDSGIPAVGASGAISGVLGMYFIWFPHNKVKLLFLLPPFMRVIDLGARWVLGFYIVAQNVVPAFMSAGAGSGGGVAHGAHIAGFVAGLLLALGDKGLERVWPARRQWLEESRAQQQETVAQARGAVGGPLGVFRAAMRQGQLGRASTLFFDRPRALIRDGLRPEEVVALGDGLEQVGEPRAAAAAYEQVLRLEPYGTTAVAAHLGLAQILIEDMQQPTAGYQHIYDALRAGPSPAQAAEARELLRRMKGQVRSLPKEAVRWS